MRKFPLVIKIFLALFLILIELFFFTKIRIKDKLNSGIDLVKVEWDGLAQLQNENRVYLRQLIISFPEIAESNDSLIILLDESQEYIDSRNCNDTILIEEYKLNNYLVALMQEISENDEIPTESRDSILLKLGENVNKLNRGVEQYNANVRAFNVHYSTFPVFLFAKSFGIKRQVYFDLTYGIVNPDPIAKRNEIPAWMKKIEEEHGFVE